MATSFKLPRKLRNMTQRRMVAHDHKWATKNGRPTRPDGSVDQEFIDKYPEHGSREKAGYKGDWHQVNGYQVLGRKELKNEDARKDMRAQLRELGII